MDILKYEKSFKSKGYHQIVGIDEAGRGPLAGPVVAVAVNWGKNTIIEGVKDSKKISEKKRLLLFGCNRGYSFILKGPHVTKCKNILDNYDNISYFLFSIWCGQKNTRYILYTLW